ncbi:serine/threonine-protein kinase [Nocardia crassostreae]|uniref:serine/threonine-protein kinase n=1 Tax=Nocardia crassostreae TaxID=53428 RepID=UPI000835703F|nr:serine/threonine-protein kinase [Nocardia crassostreae]
MLELRPGTVFAGYRIERKLGAGGMGSVYLARHPRLPRWDAVKVLSARAGADQEFRARFLREAELAARLDHPNVVAVYDRGVELEHYWIAMQYVAGSDVAQLIERGTLPPERAAGILGEAAAGLDEAHRVGLVHRDVKPANLLIAETDGRVLVTDFGIARAADDSVALTEDGSVLATLPYAAPEQINGGTVDHRADVYSLGCTLYQMLTGATPFPQATAAAVMYAHLTEPPPPPSTVVPGLPRELDRVVAAALAKNPDDRYHSCGELAAAAHAALHGKADAPTPRRIRRRRIALACGTVLLVTALAAVIAGVSRAPDRGPGTGGTATATPPGTSAPSGPWAAHQYIADTFPDLVPRTPGEAVVGSVSCSAIGADDFRPVPLGEEAAVGQLMCRGDRNPVQSLYIRCNADRTSQWPPRAASTNIIEGEQDWTRQSGKGRIIWSHSPADDKFPQSGELVIGFDDARGFCTISVLGATTGQELVDRWWNTAPI